MTILHNCCQQKAPQWTCCIHHWLLKAEGYFLQFFWWVLSSFIACP